MWCKVILLIVNALSVFLRIARDNLGALAALRAAHRLLGGRRGPNLVEYLENPDRV